jgi:hypothetical protein
MAVGFALGGGDALHDGFENLFHADAAYSRKRAALLRRQPTISSTSA